MNNAQLMLQMLDQLRETGQETHVQSLEDHELREKIIKKYGTGPPAEDANGSPSRWSMLNNVH